MRISTSTIFEAGVGTMQQQTAALLRVQQQIATGRRLLSPADDPVAAAHALEVTQSQAINAQYGVNLGSARDSLTLEESVLGSITSLLQDARDVSVQAGSAALSDADRNTLANTLRSRYQELMALANSTDGDGQYLFSGYSGATRPFSETAPGQVAYAGDQGQRLIQVNPSRQMAVGDAGPEVFLRIPAGNGSFVTGADSANSGSAVIDSGTVLDAGLWNQPGNSGDYSVRFAVAGGVTTYDLIDNTSGDSLLTGLPGTGTAPLPRVYASGSNIVFSQAGPPALDLGVRVSISGTPQQGDRFDLRRSANQDVFQTLHSLADAIDNLSGAALTNALVAQQRNLDNALENVLTVRASTGVRLKELEAIQTTGEQRALQYSETLSRLQDLDYAKAISELSQQQINLEAAQKSFLKVSTLSLFEFI